VDNLELSIRRLYASTHVFISYSSAFVKRSATDYIATEETNG